MIRKLLSNTHKLKLTNFIPRNTFCIYQAYLNPEKHINTGHNVNNVYEDIVLLGDFLLPTTLNEKQLSTTYVPQFLDVSFKYLNAKYNLKLTPKDYPTYYNQTWSEIGVSDIEAEKQELLDQLSKNIFIKNHKMRWPIEQRLRLQHTSDVYSHIELDKYYVGFFFESYNMLLQNSIERSHLWKDPNIKGDLSSLEKYNKDHEEQVTGIQQLDNISGANDNLINRLMKAIHRI